MERGHDGLLPHDLVRDAVLDEFFAREPDRYRATRRVLAHRSLVRLLDAPPSSVWPLVCDHNFLFRHRSPIRDYNDYRTMGSAFFRPGEATDLPAIDALLAEELAPEELVLARAWLAHRATIAWVAGSATNRVDGVVLTIDESLVDDTMRTIDPGTQAIMEMLARLAPPIPGRRRLLSRFHAARHGMFRVRGGLANAVQMSEWYMWTTTPALHVAALVVPRPDHWTGMMSYFQFAPLPGGDFEAGGVPHGSFWREWREMAPRDQILQRVAHAGREGHHDVTGRAAAGGTVGAPTASTAAGGIARPGGAVDVPPTRDAFALAVREALRHVTRDARLAESPLCGLHVVRQTQRPDESPPQALRRLLIETAHELRDTRHSAKFWRALDLTYFRPAGTQELAAERLGLPFNTYRYQLTTALDRLVTRLWELEGAARR